MKLKKLNTRAMSCHLKIRVIPNASKSSCEGWLEGVLKVKVQEPPESGKANRAVCELLARELGIGRREVVLIRGEKSRNKEVEIASLDESVVRKRLESVIRKSG